MYQEEKKKKNPRLEPDAKDKGKRKRPKASGSSGGSTHEEKQKDAQKETDDKAAITIHLSSPQKVRVSTQEDDAAALTAKLRAQTTGATAVVFPRDDCMPGGPPRRQLLQTEKEVQVTEKEVQGTEKETKVNEVTVNEVTVNEITVNALRLQTHGIPRYIV